VVNNLLSSETIILKKVRKSIEFSILFPDQAGFLLFSSLEFSIRLNW
jgi:hypothetical protein